MHWHVVEIIEPDISAASPVGTGRYVLLVHGPFAYLPGEGEQYITATRRSGRWRITPNTTAWPRRGSPPGQLPCGMRPTADPGDAPRPGELGVTAGNRWATGIPSRFRRGWVRAPGARKVRFAPSSRGWACPRNPAPGFSSNQAATPGKRPFPDPGRLRTRLHPASTRSPSRLHLASTLSFLCSATLTSTGEVAMVSFAWVAGVIVVLIGLIVVSEFWEARRFERALLRKPLQDPGEHARGQARGSGVPNSFGGGHGPR